MSEGRMTPKATSSQSFRNYQDGKPVRHNYFMTQERLEQEHPETVSQLRKEREEKASKDGIFLDGFGLVTAAVFLDCRLRAMDKLVYSALKLFADADGHVIVSQKILCLVSKIGVSSVRKCIKNLLQCGYVQYAASNDKKAGRTHEYICSDNPENLKGCFSLKGLYEGDYVKYEVNSEQFARVSKAVLFDEAIDKYAKLVYIAICVLSSEYMEFDGKNAYLSLFIGDISREHIQKGLKQLVQKDYIHIRRMMWKSKFIINIFPNHSRIQEF